MSRKHEQADLVFKLGQLFGPILKIIDNPQTYDEEEKARIFARFFAEVPSFSQQTRQFTIIEPGHNYLTQMSEIETELNQVSHTIRREAHNRTAFDSLIREVCTTVRNAILSIPVPLDSTIYAARTPFSTYCLVKDICSTTKAEIVWLDRYFDQGIFHRYFVDVTNSVTITLVTWPQSECRGPKDIQRYQEFLDLSKLFAKERGPDSYRLITNVKIHARWLRCDDKHFNLGDSIKDIAKGATFTLGRLDNSPETQQHFDEAITTGVEVFGKSQTNHP